MGLERRREFVGLGHDTSMFWQEFLLTDVRGTLPRLDEEGRLIGEDGVARHVKNCKYGYVNVENSDV